MEKKPRFFCDNCSAEVGRNEKACPRCGRFFASIRCPDCGFVGGDGLFAAGCPVCGRSKPNSAQAAAKPAKRGKKSGRLPFWAFFLSLGVLVFVLAILLMALL